MFNNTGRNKSIISSKLR